MDDIVKYTNYSKLKCNTKIKYFLYISVSILIILCVMIHKISIPDYYYNKGIVVKYNDENVLKLIVLDNDVNKIINNNKLKINNQKYKYEVIYISNTMVDNNYNNYYEIYLRSNLNMKLENSIHEVKINYNKQLLNKIIYDFVVGR